MGTTKLIVRSVNACGGFLDVVKTNKPYDEFRSTNANNRWALGDQPCNSTPS
jgi:hypothetical protein